MSIKNNNFTPFHFEITNLQPQFVHAMKRSVAQEGIQIHASLFSHGIPLCPPSRLWIVVSVVVVDQSRFLVEDFRGELDGVGGGSCVGDVAEGVVEVGVGGFPRGIQEGDHVSVGVGNIESISVEEERRPVLSRLPEESMEEGVIVRSGGAELVEEINEKGFGSLKDD